MKKLILTLAVLILLLVSIQGIQGLQAFDLDKTHPNEEESKITYALFEELAKNPETIPVIIELNDIKIVAEATGVSTSSLSQSFIQSEVINSVEKIPNSKTGHRYSTLLNGFAAEIPASEIESLAQDPRIKKIYYDAPVQAFLNDSIPQIGISEVWAAGYNGSGVSICIIDTGVNSTHPFFASNVSYRVTNGTNCYGYTPCDNTTAYYQDDSGHGTHVAGIAIGYNNTNVSAMNGTAPDATIQAVKVLNENGSGNTSTVVAGMEWCVNEGTSKILSLSLGSNYTPGTNTCYQFATSDAADNATRQGFLVVAASGNDGSTQASAPACAKSSIAVGGVLDLPADSLYTSTSRANLNDGTLFPDVAAPASSINSSVPQESVCTGTPEYCDDSYYNNLAGTSQAAPHVSGLAAVLLSQNSSLIPMELKAIILTSANDLGDVGRDGTYGSGRINATLAFNITENASFASYNLTNLTGYWFNISANDTDSLRVTLVWPGNSSRHDDLDLFLSNSTNILSNSTLSNDAVEEVLIGSPGNNTYMAKVFGYDVSGTRNFSIASRFEITGTPELAVFTNVTINILNNTSYWNTIATEDSDTNYTLGNTIYYEAYPVDQYAGPFFNGTMNLSITAPNGTVMVNLLDLNITDTDNTFPFLYNNSYTLPIGPAWELAGTWTINASMDSGGTVKSNFNTFFAEGPLNVSVESLDGSTATVAPQGTAVFRLNVTNSGIVQTNISFSYTPTTWDIEFVNSSINITNGTSTTVRCIITVPVNASGSQVVNASAVLEDGNTNITSFTITIDSPLNVGGITQNATDWLEGNNSSGGNWGANLTNAWVLWALNITYGSTVYHIQNTTDLFNDTQDLTNGFWTDNESTAFVIIAMKEAGYSDTSPVNLTKAVNYLQGESNGTHNYCWPAGGCDAYNTSIALTAIYKSDVSTSANETNATIWLSSNQSSDGSWNSNVEQTAWALQALVAAGIPSSNVSRLNATRWLQYNQTYEGWFGSNSSINETVMAVLALNASGNTTWIVDVDGNTSTTQDQYNGSIWKAVYWVLTQRNTTMGGWGESPPNALSTSYGILATGDNYGTVNGTVTGSGNASGTNIANALIRFSSTLNTTTNGTGVYSMNLPPSTYSVQVSKTNYITNSSVTSLNVSNGQAVTQNFGLLPALNITGAYGSNGVLASTTVNAADAVTVAGTVRYNHSGSAANNASVTVSGANTSATTTTNSSGGFSTTLTAASPSTTTAYTITTTATDTYGSTGSYPNPVSLTVNGTGSSNGGGGGGGGGATYSLKITSYTKNVTATAGSTKDVNVIVKNNGAEALDDVGLSVVGVTSSWYTVKTSDGATTEDLSSDESVTFTIKFKPPSTATLQTYSGTYKAKDKNLKATAEKDMTLTVTKVWEQTDVSELQSDIAALKIAVEESAVDIADLKAKGHNVTALEADLAALNQSVQDAESKYNSGDYDGAESFITTAKAQLSDLQSAIQVLKPKGLVAILGEANWTMAVIIIVVVAGAAGGGLVLWYKFFRVLTMQEIIKNPEMYSQGARIEGVIKSVTDTKKGKVFLVADHTGKLHVRYPYYTTVEQGDLIRSVGVVKTYKNVPYMDATDLARVSVKH